MSDLTIPATRELLDGWCGPVLTEAMVAAGVDEGSVHVGHVIGHNTRVYGWSSDWYRIDSLRLDLARAEVRDRVCRALAGALLRDVPPNGDGFSWRWEYPSAWRLVSHNLNWSAGFARDTSNWFAANEGNRTGRFPSRSVPGLADLDPDDDTRLPDGSRRVDAEALRLAWLACQEQQ